MIKIEGHGVPTKFKPAERGTVYTDLDTGKRYKCLGKKGFVNQDAVNEPVEYHWQLVDMVDESEMPEGSSSGGAKHWNDIEGKPFYLETLFDDIVWDGNTDGLESVTFKRSGKEYTCYKIPGDFSKLKVVDFEQASYYKANGNSGNISGVTDNQNGACWGDIVFVEDGKTYTQSDVDFTFTSGLWLAEDIVRVESEKIYHKLSVEYIEKDCVLLDDFNGECSLYDGNYNTITVNQLGDMLRRGTPIVYSCQSANPDFYGVISSTATTCQIDFMNAIGKIQVHLIGEIRTYIVEYDDNGNITSARKSEDM